MWVQETSRLNTGGSRRGTALVIIILLIAVLSAFTMAAVNYLIINVTAGRDSGAEARAMYLAELGRADAFAYVAQHLTGPWPYTRSLSAVSDGWNAPAGEYSYTITDLTVPDKNPRWLAQVFAYWPTQARPVAQRRLQVQIEKQGDDLTVIAWALGEYGGT